MPPSSSLLRHDRKVFKQNPLGVIGVDEVGRGAWAGPVVAACVWIKPSFFETRSVIKIAQEIKDSKLLSPEKRQIIAEEAVIWKHKGYINYATAEASIEEIESLNIWGATQLAMARALEALPLAPGGFGPLPLFPSQTQPPRPTLLIDGKPIKTFPWAHNALVGGDGKSLAIALASIIAKVTRDHQLITAAQQYPAYGFQNHKGYGTPEHQAALKLKGPSPFHRLSFLSHPIDTTAELAF